MNRQRREPAGFTLTELVISVAIVAIVSVVGISALVSNINSTRIVSAAQDLAAFLKQARSYAVTQGCRTRIIICNNKHCEDASDHSASPSPVLKCVNGASSPYHCDSTNAVSRYYGLLINTVPCSVSDQNSADGYSYWDFDKSPLGALPGGVALTAIYTGTNGYLRSDDGALGAGNTLVFSGGAGTNSLWFDPSLNPSFGNLPVANNRTASGNFVAFQVQQENCNPASSSDCMGYFVTMSPGGVAGIQRCVTGTRADGSDICF